VEEFEEKDNIIN